jgi:hypothetical protein
MATDKWAAPESTATALTTELNSLANGSYSNASSAIDNEADLYKFIDLEVVLASLTPTGSPYVAIYAVYSLDGPHYADGGGATAPRNSSLLAVLDTSTSTGAKRLVGGNYPLLPLKFKLVAQNGLGVSMASSSNTVRYRRHNGQVV